MSCVKVHFPIKILLLCEHFRYQFKPPFFPLLNVRQNNYRTHAPFALLYFSSSFAITEPISSGRGSIQIFHFGKK